MHARHFAASGPVVRYRIGAELPLEVRFPSVSYCLRLQSSEAAGRHELMAHDAKAGTWWRIGPAYYSPALLLEAFQEAGVPVQGDTVGGTIMRRLVSEGRAQVVPPPADDPAERRPASDRPLYDGEDARAALLARRANLPVERSQAQGREPGDGRSRPGLRGAQHPDPPKDRGRLDEHPCDDGPEVEAGSPVRVDKPARVTGPRASV